MITWAWCEYKALF